MFGCAQLCSLHNLHTRTETLLGIRYVYASEKSLQHRGSHGIRAPRVMQLEKSRIKSPGRAVAKSRWVPREGSYRISATIINLGSLSGKNICISGYVERGHGPGSGSIALRLSDDRCERDRRQGMQRMREVREMENRLEAPRVGPAPPVIVIQTICTHG